MTTRLYDLDGTLYSYKKGGFDPRMHDLLDALRDLGVTESHDDILARALTANTAGKYFLEPFVTPERSLTKIHCAYHNRRS